MAHRQSRVSTGYETLKQNKEVDDADRPSSSGAANLKYKRKTAGSSSDEMASISDVELSVPAGATAKSKGKSSGKIGAHRADLRKAPA